MVYIKGKMITLTAHLMSLYKDAQKFCDDILVERTGKHYYELEPEEWYDVKLLNGFITNYIKASPTGEQAIVTLGKQIYPTINKTVGLPPEINTALDLLIYEAKGFELHHKGEGIEPRKFIKKEEGHVIVQAPAPGYSQKLYEGVFLGILEMKGIYTGKVKMTKGSPEFEYEITW